MREAQLREYAKKTAISRGWMVRSLKWEGRRNAPDRMYAKEGRVVFVEFKRSEKEEVRAAQEREQEIMREYGLEVLVFKTKEAVDAFF